MDEKMDETLPREVTIPFLKEEIESIEKGIGRLEEKIEKKKVLIDILKGVIASLGE